jgi:PAS domain S-box-containing protein
MNEIANLMARNGLLPHGYCFQWSPGLLWTMVTADLSIALSYFSIPAVIWTYARRRPDAQVAGVAAMFVAFIFACGLTHVMDIWTIWQPDYVMQSAVKVITATVSVATAVALWWLLPQALRIPSPQQLRHADSRLEAESARRVSAEERLLDLEQHLAATLASIGAGFIATDARGLVTRMNPVAKQITGWSMTDAQGRSVWEVFDRVGRPADLKARNPVDVLMERAVPVEQAQHAVCKSRLGVLTPVELHAQPTLGADGAVRGMTLIFRDESRLSQAEAEVRRLASVVESSSDAIIALTLDGRITNWNAAAERMFDYSADEAVDQPVQMLVPHEREAEEVRILASIALGEAVPPFRTVRVAKDGRRIDVSVQISPIRDGAGRVVGAAKAARDLTHQRQIEIALRRSESRMRFALESAHIGDWELEPASGQFHRSLRHDQCFGQHEALPSWSRAQLLHAVHDEDRAAVQTSLAQAITQRGAWHAEFRVIWPDGSAHWLRMDAQWMRESDEDLLVGIVRDMTAQRTAEQARATADRLEIENRQVVEVSRMKSQFMANMSHELRTPLNAVIGFADLLRTRAVPADSPKHGEYLSHIAKSGRHLLQVINDVLDLSKIEAGRLEFEPATLSLPALVDEVVATLGMQAAAARLQVVSSIAPDVRTLHLDPNRLKQVLFNYLSNAIKFTPPGGRVEVRAFGEGPMLWRLEVEDSGEGIAAEDLPRLFVEFQQLDGSYAKRHQGTGLGLALTRQLVEAQGGRVGVYSTRGQGTLFYAVLPRDAALTDERPRVLVTAHDHPLRDNLARALAQQDVPHDAAGSAADVVRLARVRHYDAMTVDLALPDSQGLALVERVGRGENVPVHALAMSVPQGGVAYPVAGLIAKPLEPQHLGPLWAPLRAHGDAPLRVLVVDDDAMARELMQDALRVIGIEAHGVDGGAAALDALDRVQPDALVLDLMMPGVDGFQVLHALRQQPRWRELPVFVWTALSLSARDQAQLAASAQAIVSKGVEPADAVAQALLQWIARKEQRS